MARRAKVVVRARRPTAKDLEAAADQAQHLFWRYVRLAENEEPPADLWDEVCQAMGKLSDVVRDRRPRS
jgi:hypothetical protein